MPRLVLTLVLALIAGGCGAVPRPLSPAPMTSSGVGKKALDDAHATAYLRPNDKITTSQPIAIFLSDPSDARRSFWVMLEPTTTSDNQMVPGVGELITNNLGAPMFAFHVISGTVYVVGSMPWVTNAIVETSSEGSAFVLEVIPNDVIPGQQQSGQIARIYTVKIDSARPLHVSKKATGAPAPTDMGSNGKVIVATLPSSGGPITFLPEAAWSAPQQTFVQKVLNDAQTLGIPGHP
jgi:hypothetical protein